MMPADSPTSSLITYIPLFLTSCVLTEQLIVYASRGHPLDFFFFLIFFGVFFFLTQWFIYYYFLLYSIVLVLLYISMNPPRVYTCSPSWTSLPAPSPYHPSGSSQCTSPKHPVSCVEPGLGARCRQSLPSFSFYLEFLGNWRQVAGFRIWSLFCQNLWMMEVT